MDKKTAEQTVPSSAIRVYPAGLISLLTFLTAFPAGYVLMITNWHRMGEKEQERRHLFALAISSFFGMLLMPFYSQVSCGMVIINIAFGIYFYNEMTSALTTYEQAGNDYTKENLFVGCLIGLLAVGIWVVLATILSITLNLFIRLL